LLKEAGLQDQVEYYELFSDITRTFEIVKDLERQKNTVGDQVINEQMLNQINGMYDTQA
jgi:hypothetical protein